jgi:hypothetical protein
MLMNSPETKGVPVKVGVMVAVWVGVIVGVKVAVYGLAVGVPAIGVAVMIMIAGVAVGPGVLVGAGVWVAAWVAAGVAGLALDTAWLLINHSTPMMIPTTIPILSKHPDKLGVSGMYVSSVGSTPGGII